MKIHSPLLKKLAGTVAGLTLRSWMSTLDIRSAYYDPTIDACNPHDPTRRIYLIWHENLLLPLYARGRCQLAMLMSRHRDADILSQMAIHFGFEFVRGSTARGGDRAIRELMRRSRRWHLTITPDGPRGPRRVMAPGPIYLASRLRMPLVPIGVGCDQPWRAATWDRFVVPRPFSRARAVMGPEIILPERLGRDGIEHYRRQLQILLTRLSDEAEAWATAGTAKVNDAPVIIGPCKTVPTLGAVPIAAPNHCPAKSTPHSQTRAA